MRDLGALAVGDLPDRLVGTGLDLLSVQGEAGRLAHDTSSGKCFSTDFTGLAAAWPRPQMEASVIACDNSAMSAAFHFGCASNLTAFSVPTRHGVHWPQDSSSKKRIRLSATSRALSLSDNTTTACEPTKQPYCSSVPKSSGMSAIDAGRMPPDAPPGR